MSAGRWQRIKALFELAVEQPRSQRTEFAVRAASAQDFDSTMLEEVLSLLVADQTQPEDAGVIDLAPDLIGEFRAVWARSIWRGEAPVILCSKRPSS